VLSEEYTIQAAWKRSMQAMLAYLSAQEELDRDLSVAIQTRIVRRLGLKTEQVPCFRLADIRYQLFFDGGSRGNPGPGGSGSIVVRWTSPPEVVWVASMAYISKNTTNNLAEFQGLKHGLLAARQYGWQPLVVTGDSKLVLQFCRERKTPRARRLRWLFGDVSTAADQLYIIEWIHHYRRHNKMADAAANIAMDDCVSFQTTLPSSRPRVAEIVRWLENDIGADIEREMEAQVNAGG
jgi:ribonuclease HI